MQTFLPERSYVKCAQVLDSKRLVKQLLEGRQIMSALCGESRGWINHPATRMWNNYEHELYEYLMEIMLEMKTRGYKTENNWSQIHRMFVTHIAERPYIKPSWSRNPVHDFIIVTHRGMLHEKAPELYPQYEFDAQVFRNYVCCDKCNYYWPTHSSEYFV